MKATIEHLPGILADGEPHTELKTIKQHMNFNEQHEAALAIINPLKPNKEDAEMAFKLINELIEEYIALCKNPPKATVEYNLSMMDNTRVRPDYPVFTPFRPENIIKGACEEVDDPELLLMAYPLLEKAKLKEAKEKALNSKPGVVQRHFAELRRKGLEIWIHDQEELVLQNIMNVRGGYRDN